MALARAILRQGDMHLTAAEAVLISRELLAALRLGDKP